MTTKAFPLWAQEKGSCFVSLVKNGRLRGCCGTIFPVESLVDDVQNNALEAAFHDPRFPSLLQEELSTISIEISILSPLLPIKTDTEKEVLDILRPHIDGAVLLWKEHKSTFLPFVWSIFPEKKDFLTELKKKAGLAEDFWTKNLKIFTYTVSTWKEQK